MVCSYNGHFCCKPFAYNRLGLTEKVTRGDTLVVKYSYLADGSKASAERADGSGLVCRGSLTYRRDASGALALEGVPFSIVTQKQVRID